MVKGLYFPGLRPDEAWVDALRPLVERLVVYGVGEDESAAAGNATPWEVREVAPLGADRSRFQALLREMTGREAEVFRGQMLAMASKSGRDRDEATGWNLSQALHRLGDVGGAAEREKARVERIWQARLFLRLAEVVTTADTEVGLGLAAVASRQIEMMKALQGDDAEDDEVAEVLSALPLSRPVPRSSFRLKDHLAAWAVCYLLDPGPEALLLTADPEAAALLGDQVEKLAPGRGVTLPDFLVTGEGVDLGAVAGAMTDMVGGKIDDAKAVLGAVAEFQGSSGLASTGAPLTLRLKLLPGAEFRQAMVSLSGLPGESAAPATPYVLLGVAEPEWFYL
ncbi:MAG: hypothetical protein HGA96_02190 [Desulfobulbaceae bacterium]|nr:hypothetical protein [Desulfobulbaceae bacterium]